MPIPRYDEIQLPALQVLSDGVARKGGQLEEPLAKYFNLTKEERNQMYDSGSAAVFKDRILWALSYLNMAGLVQKPKRGIYQINEQGKKLLNKPDTFRDYINEKIQNREPTKRKKADDKTVGLDETQMDLTPVESLNLSFQGIRKSVYREIIDTILSKTPREFEKLVVLLLQKMGYGGEVEDSGLVTQYVNDKGIDGIIKEDILGFGRIIIQAKRYAIDNKVTREDIQKFVGALASAKSDNGVFITTSDFNKGAYEYVETLHSSTKIVLINGGKLAEYIYDHNVGMQTERYIEIKKMDGDFWDNMQDNEEV